jgi:hypothetical protein
VRIGFPRRTNPNYSDAGAFFITGYIGSELYKRGQARGFVMTFRVQEITLSDLR